MLTKISPHRLTPRMRRQQGQTMTEFAIVLPILALLLFAIIQFGIVFYNYVTLTDAVRAGARQGAVARHIPNPQNAVVNRVRSSAVDLDQAKLTVDVTSPFTQGSDVTVSATYPYSINLLGFVVKTGSLQSTTTSRVE